MIFPAVTERVPLSTIVLVSQNVVSFPALTVATGLNVIIEKSETGPHGPAGSLVVNVKVTEPLFLSAALGI